MANRFSINSGIGAIDQLFSRGGMDSMPATLWLIIGAVTSPLVPWNSCGVNDASRALSVAPVPAVAA